VFVFPDDHQRTRLTHALEVAQVATGIARACRLNVALTEAIALGHDCGHGPGGHASEDALDPYLDGGFDHAPWGADVSLAPAQPLRRDRRRHRQPLVVPPGAGHARR
jgi:dGTPase